MSVQAAQDFLEKLQSDQNLKAIFRDNPDPATRHQLALDAGFDFTLEEFEQTLRAQPAGPDAVEMSPEELEKVAGGAGPKFQIQNDMSGYNNNLNISSSLVTKFNSAVSNIISRM